MQQLTNLINREIKINALVTAMCVYSKGRTFGMKLELSNITHFTINGLIFLGV